MGWLRDLDEVVTNFMQDLSIDRRRVKIAIYLFMAILTILTILFMFSMAFAGSYNPFDIISSPAFNFSYGGTPSMVSVTSDYHNFGINSAEQPRANVTVWGRSNITIDPENNIVTRNDRAWDPAASNNTIRTYAGDTVITWINVTEVDDSDYNMDYYFNRNGKETAVPGSFPNASLKIYQRPNNTYKIMSTFSEPVPKEFRIKDSPRYNYPITIKIEHNPDYYVKDNMTETFKYTGRVDILTNDTLRLEILARTTSPSDRTYLHKVNISNADGTLDVRQNEYKCSHADSILVNSSDGGMVFQLMGGEVSVNGQASELLFRERNFGKPYTVILKEGNFAIFTGILMTLLTIFLGKLHSYLKKQ